MQIMHRSSLSFSYFMQNTNINQPPHPHFYSNTTTTKMVGCSSKRNEGVKERTKLRERHRRAITTNIFHGLRKFGGYPLPPRADINQLLRELAKEAGWVVHPDGTTYRHKLLNPCPTCGSFSNAMPSATTTSTIIPGPGSTSGGEFSTTASPCRINPKLMIIGSNTNDACTTTRFYGNNGSSANDGGTPLPLYIYTGLADGIHQHNITTAALDKVPTEGVRMQQQGAHITESRASNSNTPVGSPLHTLY